MDKQELIEKYEKLIQQNKPELEESKLAESRSKLYNNILRELKRMDDGITTEQAWEKIAEEYKLPVETVQQIAGTTISSAVKKEDIAISDGCIILNPNLTEPEKPEIPKFVAKEIPSAPREALDCYYNPGAYIIPPYSYKVITWIEGHFDIFLQALVNGFEIQKEPVWVVKTFAGYLTKFETFVNNNWRATTSNSKDDKDIITFECKEKANEIATLIDGEVEEWSEKDEPVSRGDAKGCYFYSLAEEDE